MNRNCIFTYAFLNLNIIIGTTPRRQQSLILTLYLIHFDSLYN